MNKKLFVIFIFSAMVGCSVLGMLVYQEFFRGPELALHNVTVELNEEISAWSFVTECSEENATVRYIKQPRFDVPGGQEVEIEAIGSNGKKTVRKATLKVSIIKSNLKLDATGEEIKLEDILVDGIDASQVSFVYKAVKLNHVGDIDIKLLYQNVEYDSTITVVDAKKPEVTLKGEIIAYQKHEFDPMSAVETLQDATDVTAGYKGMLDLNTLGEYTVTLVYTDEGDNSTELMAKVNVIADTEPPVISGAVDREYYLGETISYLDGVTAKDSLDGSCEVYVDNSSVDVEKEGTYEVSYTASDISGNQTEVKVKYTLKKMTATEERLNEKADEVLAEITTDTMSLSKKAYEIYNYAYSNIEYTGTSDKSDWEAEAYRGLNEKKGDCFTYASVCKILLKRAGIQTMDVSRVGGDAEHYWLLVNTGSGWYHFDATRRKIYFDGFMARDEDVAAYTEQVGNNYYTFDRTKYPATPTEKYVVE